MLKSRSRIQFVCVVVSILGAAATPDVRSEDRSGRPGVGGSLSVVTVEPVLNALGIATDSDITVHFDRPLDVSTVTSTTLAAAGRWSGSANGPITFSDDNRAATLSPMTPFSAGETVTVVVANAIRGEDGSAMRSGGYSFQFWTRAAPTTLNFVETSVMTTNVAGGTSSQPYGGIGSDLDGDGWLDLAIVNEITEDLRVFMNSADGMGTFAPFEQPPFALNSFASPSEAADFNGDGLVDICVGNKGQNTVSILLGNGDGTFQDQQEVQVAPNPTGIAVLDADGDGDIDIVTANLGSSSAAVLLNDGAGIFGPPTAWDPGGAGEHAAAAADMDNDGILDIVIGARNGQQIIVNRGNGDGTFTPVTIQSAGGRSWMVVVGDVNGDGNQDVATANSTTNNGAILFGDGAGGLSAPQIYATDPFAIATDLADLDGDGDLDWIISSFSGDWFVFLNDGSGVFSFHEEWDAPETASCSIPFDIDNDGDLDVALIDETADVLIIRRNMGIATCFIDEHCDDQDSCNGIESCDTKNGECLPGVPIDCDDGDTCNGVELCARDTGDCGAGVIDDCDGNGIDDSCDLTDCGANPECDDCDGNGRLDGCDVADGHPDENGNGVLDLCESCTDNASCDDSDTCSFDRCIDNLCSYDVDAKYGDVAGDAGACGPDGDVNLSDILSVLNGFADTFAEGCERVNIDIAGDQGSCDPNNTVDLTDIIVVLDAFRGVDRCCAARR